MNPSTRAAAGQRRKPPDARAGCPESRLGLPLSDSPPSGLQAKKCSSSLGLVFLKSPSSGHQQVPCSAGPARCAQRRAARGHTVAADLSARAPGSSASGLAIQEAPRADGAVTRTALPDEPWPGTRDDWAAADGCEGLAAQRRVHPAGRTARGAGRAELGSRCLQHHGQVARSGLTASWAASPRASCRSPQRPLLPEYPPDRFQTRLSRDASASLHLAPK